MNAELASQALLLWASMTAGPLLVASSRRARRMRAAELGRVSRRGLELEGREVHLVRPCAGSEPELVRSLSSLPEAAGARLVVSFCIEREDDAARPAIDAALATLLARGVEGRLVISRAAGPNRKVQQILAALRSEAARDVDAQIVLVADSDVDLEGYPLSELVLPLLRDRAVGAVWAAPHEAGSPSSAGDLASGALLGASLHSFALLAELDPAGLVGKCFAARRSTLERTVRLDELDRYLGEDMELSRRLVERGATIELAATGVRSLAAGRQLGATVERFGRWLAVIRAQRPALLVSYPLMFFPLTSIALFALALATPIAGLAVSVALVVRLATAWAARRATSGSTRLGDLARDVAFAEVTLAAAWLRALSSRRFAWRERWMRLGPDGRLLAADPR
jgi:ceramide glucosyltransferase